jgi:hypothetical protein
MLAVFCLRLAVGLLACLLLLQPARVNPRYFRTHFLTTLGLAGVSLAFVWETAGWPVLSLLLVGTVLAFLGSLSWALEGAPGGRTLVVLTGLVLGTALGWYDAAVTPGRATAPVLAGDLTSAALLGASLSAMLMGHIYLMAPAMSLTPLLRLLAAVVVAAVARLAVDGYALWSWTATHPSATLRNDLLLWLPVRWGVGFVLPLVLTWMAWQSARIRSTQSATGILYVVVIFCFLGELTGLLLRDDGLTL